MSLFLHIGYPKTSTTYLQNYYFNKLDLNFLGKKEDKKWLNSKKRLKFIKIIDALNNNKYLTLPSKKNLISAEGLIGNIWENDFSEFNSLDESLKNRKIKVIVTIRKQSSIFYSIYKQYLWEGGKKNYIDFYKSSFSSAKNGFNINFLNYYELYKKLSKNFGRKNFIILPSEMINEKYFDNFNQILTDFLQLKKKRKIKYISKLIRTGYNSNEQFYVRICNIILNKKLNTHHDDERFYGVMNKILNIRSYFLKIAQIESFFFERKTYKLNEINNKIDKYFYRSNLMLSKKMNFNLGQFKYY